MPDSLASLQAALGDRYAVESVIGRGGMAVVYRALDRRLDRTVAIKVLSSDLAPLLGEERFQREIQVAARLQHPGIVPLYEAGSGADGLFYYTMPFVEGETLRGRLERERQLPLEDAMRITLEVADALRFAHGHGVIHRDIKPENILLSGDRVQVTDFGIARAISIAGEDRLTSAGVAIGTPSYMSPEQASHDDAIDGRADVYSLGCVCYEMLAGQPPFSGATPQAVVARHMADPVPSLRVVRPAAAGAIEAVIGDALAKSPADRPDADELIHRLREAMAHPERGRARTAARRRVAIAAVALVLAVLGWLRFGASGPPLDRNTVVVFPLTVPGRDTLGLGVTVGHLIGSNLENTEPLRWQYGGDELAVATDGDPQVYSRRQAQRIARRFGAAWYVDGEVLTAGDSLTVTVRLHDAVSDSSVQRSATGALVRSPSAVAPALAMQAMIPLLERLVGPARHVDLSYLRDRDAAAIALWLQGEQLYRSARFDEALDRYLRALEVDTTLAVAALTASGVAIWTRDAASLADSLARLALRHAEGLPQRSLEYGRGMLAYTTQQSDLAVAHFERVIAIDSLWPEGWMMLGDSYHHLLPEALARDSLADAAFVRAVHLDPAFGPALFHLTEELLRTGRVREGRRMLERFREVAPAPSYIPQLEMMLACQEQGASGLAWREQARRVSQRVLSAARLLGAGAARPDCARAAAEAILAAPRDSVLPGVRWGAFVWLHHWAAARGARDSVRALVDSGVRTVHPAALGLHVLNAVEGHGDSASAAGVIAMLDAPLDGLYHDRLWYLGRWAAHVGDTARLDAVMARLRVLADSGGRSARTVRDGLRARRALLGGDTVGAIEVLTSMRHAPGDLLYGMWESGASEQLLLARLQLATGRPAQAMRTASQFDQTQTVLYLFHLPASLAVRLRAAEELGDGATAEQMRARMRQLGREDLPRSLHPPERVTSSVLEGP